MFDPTVAKVVRSGARTCVPLRCYTGVLVIEEDGSENKYFAPGVGGIKTEPKGGGGEEETEELVDLVAIYRGVLLYGASGDGKSSLVNAGLLSAAARRQLHPERVRVQPRAGEEIVI